MPMHITQERSIPEFRIATNSLLIHSRNLFELKGLLAENIMIVTRDGDAVDHRTINSLSKNLEANLQLELSSAKELLGDIEAAEQILRGSVHPSVAQASHPCSLVSVAASILQSGRSLDRMELDSPETVQARGLDRKGLLSELQSYTDDLTQTVSDLGGLQQSLTAKRFVGIPDCHKWTDAVEISVKFVTRKYKGSDVYRVPASKLGG